MKTVILYTGLLFFSNTAIAKEIIATSLLPGLFTDSSHHFQEYKTKLTKKELKYKRYEKYKLKYDIQYMVKQVGKVNFTKTTNITNVSYQKTKTSKFFEFNIDSTIIAFMINLQNKNHSKDATVKLFDPNGELVVNDSENGVTVLDSQANTIIKIIKPIYGKWRIEFDLDSDFTGQITGITPIKLHSFSFVKTVIGRHGRMYINTKSPLPIIGSPSKITLFGEKLYDPKSIKVKFVNLDNGKSKQIAVKYIADYYDIYLERSKPLGKLFDIYVEGRDINGYLFTRKTKMPFSNY